MQNQKIPNTTNSVGSGKDGSRKGEGSSGRLKETFRKGTNEKS